MKVLIIGLDGATWDVFDESLLNHCMPNLARLKSKGCWGILQSTEPPTTPAAWTTCITGCNPQTHGITGFRRYCFNDNGIKIGNSTDSLVPNFWQELSAQGFKVASINVPWTYPCQEVNGIMVAGYGCPGPQSSFTYPGEFRGKLLAQIPDYEIMANWDWSPRHDFDAFNQNVERVERSFDQRFEAARLVSKLVNWHIMMIQFHDIDMMEHCILSYLDGRTRDNYIAHRDRLFKMFEKLDIVIGRLLDLSSSRELLVVVVSDHGHTRRVVDVRPNMLLHQWGYLKFKRASQRFMRRMRQNLLRHLPGKKRKEGKLDIGHDEYGDCDWSLSKAIMLFTAVSGYVFLNVKGRQPNGCVHPGEEYDSIVQDLRMRFSELKCPVSGQPIFRRVGTPAEIYDAAQIDAERFGDLILVPRAGYVLKSSCSISRKYGESVPEHSAKGCHCPEGIYVLSGQNIKAAAAEEAQIADIAPTVYAALAAKLPSYMDGRVLGDAFSHEVKIEYQTAGSRSGVADIKKQQLSALEEVLVRKRLAQLGYLE